MKNIFIIDQGKGVFGRRGAIDALRLILKEESSINGLDNSNVERLKTFISECNDEDNLLFINSNATKDLNIVKQYLEEFKDKYSTSIAIAPCILDDEEIDVPELNIEKLAQSAAETDIWPLGCLCVQAGLLHQHLADKEKISEVLIYALCDAAIKNLEIHIANTKITLDNTDELCFLYAEQRAQLLSYVVNNCNIEDLYPQHAWSSYGEESAAVSYQTLAALFYKLGDIENAKECLSFSDQLEDSPRALALKALIAMHKGESLGAIANLISSLQQYELRKKEPNDKHYINFSPESFEDINSCLHRGLEALNKRDNKTAVQHFASAVFDFDDFYSNVGIDSIS